MQVGIVHDFAVDGARFVLREHDGGFGTDAGAGGAVGFAVVLVLYLELFFVIHAVHAEETERQALHAVGATVVVDHGEPWFPVSGVGRSDVFAHLGDFAGGGGYIRQVECIRRRRGGLVEVADLR